jgi:hypothetical protein
LRRRALLRLLPLAALAPIVGCTERLPAQITGSFLQPWADDFAAPETAWRQRLERLRALGCDEVTLQWASYRDATERFAAKDGLILRLFEFSAELGIALRIGLPYDATFWQLGERDLDEVAAWLQSAQAECLAHIAATPHPGRADFVGWYLPYELDQHSWAEPERRVLLVRFLATLATRAGQSGGRPLAVSTFASKLPGGDLVALWEAILDAAAVRPMLQDGAGTLPDCQPAERPQLTALAAMLRRRGQPFDVIVELFDQCRTRPGREPHSRARAADIGRVATQLRAAARSGAERIVGFALDPYMLANDADSVALRRAYADRIAQ